MQAKFDEAMAEKQRLEDDAAATQRKMDSATALINALAENWKLRPMSNDGTRVVISGAGPVGLRAAVEAALMTTEVYRRFGARDKHLRSLSLRDGDLNGSYCRWANEQVGRRALAFNADLSIEF